MKQYDIEQLIMAEGASRRREDREHLAELQHRIGADEGTLVRNAHRLSAAAAIATLMIVPITYDNIMPTREPELVVCNQRGGEALVMARACESMGKADNCMICDEINRKKAIIK